jgi:hypothetical protein
MANKDNSDRREYAALYYIALKQVVKEGLLESVRSKMNEGAKLRIKELMGNPSVRTVGDKIVVGGKAPAKKASKKAARKTVNFDAVNFLPKKPSIPWTIVEGEAAYSKCFGYISDADYNGVAIVAEHAADGSKRARVRARSEEKLELAAEYARAIGG